MSKTALPLTVLALLSLAVPALGVPIAIYTEAGGGDAITTANFDHDWDTPVRTDSVYALSGSGTGIECAAGHHLVLYSSRFDSTGGSNRSEVQSHLLLGGTSLPVGWSQGYVRRSDGADECLTAGGGIIDVTTDGDPLTLRSFRTDANSGAGMQREPNASGIQLLKLDDSWDYCRLSRSADQAGPSGNENSWIDVVYDAQDELDTGAFAHASGSGDVVLNEAGHYLVLANTYFQKPNNDTRTAFKHRLTLDGTEVDGSRTTVYLRGNTNSNSCNDGAASIGTIISAAAGQVLNVECAKEVGSQPQILAGRTGLSVVKLPDGDYIRLSDTRAQNYNAASTTPMGWDTELELSPAFTHADSQIGVAQDDDYLFFTSLYDDDDGGQRNVFWQRWRANGTTLYDCGHTGRYSRNDQNQANGNWSGILTALSGGDTIEVVSQALGNSGTLTADMNGLQGVRLSSLFAVIQELVWDEAGPGNWADMAGGTSRWLLGGSPTPEYPTVDFDAVIRTDLVTVAAAQGNQAAKSLRIDSGGLMVEPTTSLAVGGLDMASGSLDVQGTLMTGTFDAAAGTALTVGGRLQAGSATSASPVALGPGAELAIGSGSLAQVTGNGDSAFEVSGDLTVGVYDDQGIASTLTKTGGGVLRLPDVAATPASVFHVVEGTLSAAEPDALGDSEQLVLSGGVFEVRGEATYAPGLLGGHHSGNPYTGANSGNLGIVSGPLGGRSNSEHWDDVIGHDNSTLLYTGQIYLGGPTTFVESIDDRTHLSIGGTPVLDNATWNDTTHGTYSPAVPGWYDVEILFSNGTGGYGPVTQDGWSASFGFGIDPGGNDNEDESNFVFPEEDLGTPPTLFRYGATGGIDLASTDVAVTAGTTGSGIHAITDAEAAFGHLSIGGGSDLSLSGGRIGFASTGSGPGSTLSVGPNGVLLGGTTTNGDANIGGSGRADALTYDDQGVGGTMRVYGDATLALDNSTPGSVVADSTVFRIEGNAVLDATGDLPLGAGDTRVVLDGGTFQATPLAGDLEMSDTDFSVLADSDLQANTSGRARFGSLTFDAPSVLTTSGAGGGMHFADTTFAASGTSGFNTQTTTFAGALDAGGQGVTVLKQGAGDLVLDQPGSGLDHVGFEAQAGRLVVVGTEPAGGASFNINGGELVLTSAGPDDVVYTNRIDVTGTGTLTAGWEGVAGLRGRVVLPSLVPTGGLLTLRDVGACSMVFPDGINPEGGSVVVPDALAHYGYHINSDALAMDLHDNGGMMGGGSPVTFQNFYGQALLTDGPGGRGLDFNNDADFRATGAIGQNDNYSNLFVGMLHVDPASAGDWEFHRTSQDDRTGIWIDLDQDGIFESTPPGLGSNRGEQLAWNDGGTKTVSLAEGDYMVAFTHREGSGGSHIEMQFRSPLMGGETMIKPADPAQAGLWSAALAPAGIEIAEGEIQVGGPVNLTTLILSDGMFVRTNADVFPDGKRHGRDVTAYDTLTLNSDLAMTHGGTLTTTGATVTIADGATLWIDHPVEATQLNIHGNLVRTGTGSNRDVTVAQAMTLGSTLDMTGGGSLHVADASITVNGSGELTMGAPLVAEGLAASGRVSIPGAQLNTLSISGGTTTTTGDLDVGSLGGAGGTLVTDGDLTIDADGSLAYTGAIQVNSGHLVIDLPSSGGTPGGALSHWALDEAAGATTAVDAMGNYDGAITGATPGQAGIMGGAYLFDGNNDYIDFGNVAEMSSQGAFTAAVWFQRQGEPGSATNHNVNSVLFGKSHESNNDNFELGSEGSQIEIYIDSASGSDTTVSWTSPGGIADNVWHHVAVTYDQNESNELKLYWNGDLVQEWNQFSGALDQSNGSSLSTGVARPDRGDPWGEFQGLLDEAYIYTRALSLTEIQALAGGGGGGQVGDVTLAPGAQVTFQGAPTVTATMDSIGVAGGPAVGGGLTMPGGANVAANAPGDTLTLNSSVDATSFNVTGPGTVALTDDVTVAAGGSFTIAADATAASDRDLIIDAAGAMVAIAGGIRVDSGTLTLTVPADSLPGGALTHWRLDETAGLNAENSVAPGTRDGTLVGYPGDDSQWIAGVIGNALTLDGSNDQVTIQGWKGVTGTQARTMSAWVRTTTNDGAILSWGENTAGHKWIFRTQTSNGQSGAIRVEVNGGYIVGGTDIRDDQWHHVAAVLPQGVNDVNQMLLYVDGQLEPISASQSNTIDTFSNWDVVIGSDDQPRRLAGAVDEIFIFDRDLAAAEIAALYEAGLTGSYAPQLGTLTMAPGTTLILGGGGGGVFNSITAGHDATIQGDIAIAGDLTPGTSFGTLNVTGSLVSAASSAYHWETDGASSDLVAVDGDLHLGGGGTIVPYLHGVVPDGAYDLLTYTGTLTPGTPTVVPGNAYAELIDLGASSIGADADSVFLDLVKHPTTQWNSSGPGWNIAGHWTDGIPDAGTAAVVDTAGEVATVTAAMGTQQAHTLIIDGGSVLVDGGDLQVVHNAHVLPTGQLTVNSTFGAAELHTAGATRFGAHAAVDVPLIRVTGGTTMGTGTELGAGTTLDLAGGTLAGSFTSLNASTTPGSCAYEVESGASSAALLGAAASLRKSTPGPASLDGTVRVASMSIEDGTLTLGHAPALEAQTLTVQGGSLVSHRAIHVGKLDLPGGTLAATRLVQVGGGLTGNGRLVADGGLGLDLTAASTVNFNGELHVTRTDRATIGSLVVTLPAGSFTAPAGADVYYSFDDSSDALRDDSGNGHDGSGGPVSAPVWTATGRLGGAVAFDGSQGILPANWAGILENQKSQFTMACWINLDDASGQQTVFEEGGTTNGAVVWTQGDVLRARIQNDSGPPTTDLSSASALTADWHHVAVVYGETASDFKLYLDGSLVDSGAFASQLNSHTDDPGIGFHNNQAPFQPSGDLVGRMDEFYYYDGVALSATQIAALAGQGAARLGNLRLDPQTQLTLDGAGAAVFSTIGATGGPMVTGELTLGSGANVQAASSILTFNASVDAQTFEVTGPGSIVLKDRLAVAPGGSLSVPQDVTLSSVGSVAMDIASAAVSFLGTLKVDEGTLTIDMPSPADPPGGLEGATRLGNLAMASGTEIVLAGSRTAGFSTAALGDGATIRGNVALDQSLDVAGAAAFDGVLGIGDGMVYEWHIVEGPQDLVEVMDDLVIDGSFTLRLFGAGGRLSNGDAIPIFLYNADLFVGGDLYDPTTNPLDYVIEIGNVQDPDSLYLWDTCEARLEVLTSPHPGIYLAGVRAELVPEPATVALLGIGLACLAARRRRRCR